jgi:uncharacterized protein (DUF433 family)
MALDWSDCPEVESIPGKVSGAWLFKGTRLPVQAIFENLEAGLSIDEITQIFDIGKDEVCAVVNFVKKSLDKVERWLYDRASAS